MRYMDLIVVADRSTSLDQHIVKVNTILSYIRNLIKFNPLFAGVYLSVLQFPVRPGEDPFYIKGLFAGNDQSDGPIKLTAWGNTNPAAVLNKAAEYALERYDALKSDENLRGAEIAHPLIIFLNDGRLSAGTDTEGGTVDPEEQLIVEKAYDLVCEKIRRLEAQRKFQVRAFGMGSADIASLKKLTGKEEYTYDFTDGSLENYDLTNMLAQLCAKVFEATSKYIGAGDMAAKQVVELTPELRETIGGILANLI